MAIIAVAFPALAENWTLLGNNIYKNNSGNVGIGTTTPADLLDLQGSYPTFRVYNTNSSQYAGSGFYLINSVSSLGNEAGTTFYNGINDGSATQGYFAVDQTNTSGGGINHWLLFNYDSQSMTFYSSGNPRMSIISNGNVGIGTTTPAQALDVNGNIKLSGNIVSNGDICIGTCP